MEAGIPSASRPYTFQVYTVGHLIIQNYPPADGGYLPDNIISLLNEDHYINRFIINDLIPTLVVFTLLLSYQSSYIIVSNRIIFRIIVVQNRIFTYQIESNAAIHTYFLPYTYHETDE